MSERYKRNYFILFLILILAALLRFYHLPERAIFNADQEFSATFATEVLRVFPVRLIGQGISVQGLFIGPWYFYLLVPFYALFNLHPMGGYVGSIMVGLATVVAYYLIIRVVAGERAGLTAAFLRALLFPFVRFDLLVTPAFSVDVMVLFTWYCFYRIWHGDDRLLLPLGLVFGLYTSFHLTLFPFYIVFAILIFCRRRMMNPGLMILSGIFFLAPVIPLALFEYFRKFLDLKSLVNLRTAGNGEVKTLLSLWEYFKIFLMYPVTLFSLPLSGISALAEAVLLYGLDILLLAKMAWWKDRFHLTVIAASASVFTIYYFFLPVHVPDYYLLGLAGLVFIYLSIGLSCLVSINKGWIYFLVMVGLAGLSLNVFKKDLEEPGKISFLAKETVIKTIAARSPDNRMEVGYDVDYGQQFGLGYLARYYRIDPKGGPGVPHYTIVIPISRRPDEISFSSGGVGLIIK